MKKIFQDTRFVKTSVFLRRFRDPIRVSRISNRVPRIKENYHRVPKIRENRVPTNPYRVPNIFLKKTLVKTIIYLDYSLQVTDENVQGIALFLNDAMRLHDSMHYAVTGRNNCWFQVCIQRFA